MGQKVKILVVSLNPNTVSPVLRKSRGKDGLLGIWRSTWTANLIMVTYFAIRTIRYGVLCRRCYRPA